VPDLRLAVHAGLRLRELARRLPLDQVAGHGERSAGKADDRLVGPQLLADEADRLEHERHRLARIGNREPLDVVERRDRPLDDRPDALDELDVDPHAENGEHDVREEDGCVDAVGAHRLKRHLGAELGRPADLEE
jgi:hypothetical protein